MGRTEGTSSLIKSKCNIQRFLSFPLAIDFPAIGTTAELSGQRNERATRDEKALVAREVRPHGRKLAGWVRPLHWAHTASNLRGLARNNFPSMSYISFIDFYGPQERFDEYVQGKGSLEALVHCSRPFCDTRVKRALVEALSSICSLNDS